MENLNNTKKSPCSMYEESDDRIIQQENMKVKIKKIHKDAIIPTYAKEGDAGLDLTAIAREYKKDIFHKETLTYHTGLAIEIPKGYVGLLFPRSSVIKKRLTMSNSVGVIDSGYRGEIMVVFNVMKPVASAGGELFAVGDRIAQLLIIPIPTIELEEVEELSETNRGDQGFGSSGA